MQINWGYFWRNVGFHLVWWTLSPFAVLFQSKRGVSGIKRTTERMDLVYESMMKKYVIRPSLASPLQKLSDEDIDTLRWLSEKYPFTMLEVYEIWEDNDRRTAMTIEHLKARVGHLMPLKK